MQQDSVKQRDRQFAPRRASERPESGTGPAEVNTVDAYGLVVTILVMLGIVVLILLFERRRSRDIESDLRRMASDRARQERPGRDPDE